MIKGSSIHFLLLFGIIISTGVSSSPVLLQENTLVIGTTDSIRNLDPSDAYDYFSPNTLMQITHGLMEMPIDSTDAVKGPIVDSFTVSGDALVYTFELKSGIKFSDGEVFDAKAMKWLLDRSIALQGDPSFLLADVVDNVTASGQILTINLSTPDATFLQRLTFTVAWPISPLSLSEFNIEGDPDSIPVGLGPYMITKWTKGIELILEANPNYFGEPPGASKIIIKFYYSSSELLTALEVGEIDVAHKLFGPDERHSIIDSTNLKYVTKETAGIRYLVLNVEQHKNKAVRQAIAAAVDRSEISKLIFDNLSEPIYSMVPKIFSSSIDAFDDGPNQTHVSELMEGAGYSTTNKYILDFWYSPSHYGWEEKDVADLLRIQLEATGYFTLNIKNLEWSSYVGDFETLGFFLLGWWYDYPDASNYIDPFAGAGAFSLGTNYTSSTMNGYLNTMLTNISASARSQASKDAQNLVAEDVMVVPLFSMLKQFSAMQMNVTGFNLEPSENVHYNSIEGFTTHITTTKVEISTSTTFISSPSDNSPTSEVKLPIGNFFTTFAVLVMVMTVLMRSSHKPWKMHSK